MPSHIPPETNAGDTQQAVPVTARTNANGAGAATLTVGPVPLGNQWLINYVTVTVAGATTAAFSLYVNEALPANILDGTSDAISAVAPYNPPRVLDQGQQLVGVFAGAPAGANCSMRVEYDVRPVS
jgi:hypothetical protein